MTEGKRLPVSARALGRIILFLIVAAIAAVIAEGTVGPVLRAVFGLSVMRLADDSYITAIALLASTVVCVRYIDKQPWSVVWMGREAAEPGRLAFGFLLGTLAIGLPIVVLIGTHWLTKQTAPAGSWMAAFIRVSLLLLPAALLEELLTRGYILSVIRETWGWKAAILVTSIGFGLMHAQNPGATPEFVALVTLAGFFLAAVLYVTRSLYAAWMAHFAWNWTMAALFHVAVSGLPLEAPDYRYVDAGPNWATGGEWGPEGGIPAGLGMMGGMALMLARRRRFAGDVTGVTDIQEPQES